LTAKIQEINLQIKDLQRESYFIEHERKRKVGVMQKIKDELQETKKRELLKKSIEAKIKKEVFLFLFKPS
jgi:histone acetyltransferase (RNA polymerase elongator complex component)